MKKIGIISFILTLSLLTVSSFIYGAGLTANFGEVHIDNLRIGCTFSTKNRAHLPYIITNVGTKPIDVKVDVLIPTASELKKDYLPVPDINWVKLEKDFFTIKPNEQVATDIIFDIPNDEKLMKKKFQVILCPYTYEGMVKVQLKSDILFSIDTEKGPYPTFLSNKEAKGTISFELSPSEIYIENVRLGEKIDVEKITGKVLNISNSCDQEWNFYLNSRPFAGFYAQMKQGYSDAPDTNFLTFEPAVIAIKPHESKPVKLFLQFPKDKKYRQKKYAFLIPVVLGEQEVPMVRYAHLYVTTK